MRLILTWLAPVAAVVVVFSVLKGAGVPLSVPGVVIVLILLFVVRVFVGRLRGHGRRRG